LKELVNHRNTLSSQAAVEVSTVIHQENLQDLYKNKMKNKHALFTKEFRVSKRDESQTQAESHRRKLYDLIYKSFFIKNC